MTAARQPIPGLQPIPNWYLSRDGLFVFARLWAVLPEHLRRLEGRLEPLLVSEFGVRFGR